MKRPMIKPLLLSGALLLSPLALAQSEGATSAEQQAQRDALRAELDAARAELAEAARRMARLQRQLVEEGGHRGRWQMKMGEGDENIEIIVDSAIAHAFGGTTPKLGILVGGEGGDFEVLGLTPGGGAEAAGLQSGDKVVEVNGMAVGANATIGDALADLEAGTVVPVVVERDGQRMSFDVETSAPEHGLHAFAHRFAPEIDLDVDAIREGLEGMEREIIRMHEGDFPMPPDAPHAPRLPGLFVLGGDSDLVSNHDGLASYFGTGDGVVVLRIGDDNPLQLADGDVILSIDGESISRPADLGRAMLDREAGDTVVLEIMRDGTLQQVEGTVPESRFPRLHRKREVGMGAPRPPRPARPAAPVPTGTY
ncbi:PDZ domain-containing protein [Halomonas denitrificans]|nr:PDZ domain-containing protein [Halomonas denitrificans]